LYLVREYIHTLTLSINHALALSYRRNPYDPSAVTFVAHISLVKGVPFFGYHVGYKFFLKVYLLNPSNMTRLADLLIQGAVLARILQPHESHMQYLAQWMCDYNLFGCGYIDCEKVRFRGPLPEFDEMSNGAHKWHDQSVSADSILHGEDFPRQSHCSLEIDLCIQDIMNRRETKPRLLHHDFLERFHELGPDEKFVDSMAGLWRDETKRRKKKMGLSDPGSSPFPPEVLVSMSADVRAEKSNWIHEEEYRELMNILIDQEKVTSENRDVSFETFVQTQDNEQQIQTAIESVADLYPENLLKHDETLAATPNRAAKDSALSALVNTESISQAPEEEDDGYHSDEEAEREMAMAQESPSKFLTKLRDGQSEDKESRDELLEYEKEEKSSRNVHNDPTPDTNKRKPETSAGSFGSYHRSVRRRVSQNEDLFEEIDTIRKRKLYERSSSELVKGNETGLAVIQGSLSTGKASTPRRVTFQTAQSNSPISGGNESPDVVGGAPRVSSQLSQGSINARGPTTLAFPVVKNPHDPDTELRLSQRNEYSNSQALRTPAPKQAALATSNRTPITPWTFQKSISSGPSPVNNKFPSQLLKATSQLKAAFNLSTASRVCCLAAPPPTAEEVSSTIADYELPPAIFQDAYYSDERDVPERPREYAGKEFKLQSNSLPFLPDFDPTATSLATAGEKPAVVRDRHKEDIVAMRRSRQCTLRNWELLASPPTADEVERWLVDEHKAPEDQSKNSKPVRDSKKEPQREADFSQIDGPTQKNNGHKYSQKQTSTGVEHETQYMSIMSLEVHVNTRGSLAPNPEEDRVECIFWCIETDDGKAGNRYQKGILILSAEDGIFPHIARTVSPDVFVEYEEDELEMLNKIIDIVRHHDPDILTGYEVHNGSWGYLMERARLKYEFNISDEFSRMKSQSHGRFGKEADRWGFEKTSSIRVTGRHMINVWRAMRGELNLLQYTMENVVFHILHKRIPHYTHTDLTKWYKSGKPRNLAKTINYFLSRTQLNLQILESNELIARTSEQARLLGVDFFSVFSRGSQFKVESLMFRIAKPENYILVSPSRKQVGMQNALECLPLVMEPQSAFYPSPVLVLDFQSLYPSVMIAYNYCYSTCLGRVVSWRGKNKMGFTDFKREPRLLEMVKDHVNIAPNGLMYVRPEMRKSLLAKMLGEILETRVMVKSGMKQDKEDKTLQRLLNNRQLALKLIANVTYGYTSASFSGRMPCSEIADSIVQSGRETLEKAIAMIHSVSRWGAEVVYGDTDSLFVSLKGRTKDQAFEIGKEIADAVTNANPRPIKLKFEKVYHPCVLLAKKRYVGFKYESPNQKEPEFDAKGIETVRRDGTPAEQKIEEKALKILFRTQDLSEVKRYFQNQCTKIMTGRVSIQDFLFAKEVKLGTYSDKGPPPPGALIATKRMLEDPRKEPQYGERIPYVVITGAPGARLIDRCVDPETLLKDDQIELDAEYYISKNLIPPLERIFNLVGANVRSWYDEMPKIQRVRAVRTTNAIANATTGMGVSKKTLESYLQSTVCLVCRSKLPTPPPANATTATEPQPLPVCEECVAKPAAALYALRMRLHRAEKRVKNVHDVCRSCSGLSFGDETRCDSRDCPVFYTRIRENAALGNLQENVGGIVETLESMDLDLEMDW
jgi:DNA polymerase zeta